jgi:hypothetical protein
MDEVLPDVRIRELDIHRCAPRHAGMTGSDDDLAPAAPPEQAKAHAGAADG